MKTNQTRSSKFSVRGWSFGLTLLLAWAAGSVAGPPAITPSTAFQHLAVDIGTSADGAYWLASPFATDPPPTGFRLMTDQDFIGPSPRTHYSMSVVAIPRHGGRPSAWPGFWPPDQPLPGAVNVSFFDGHGELVKLDRLWQLYWHKDFQPPAKRPGLP